MTNPIPTWRETLGNSPALVAAGAVGQAMQQEIDLLRVRLSEVEKDAARWGFIRKKWKTVNLRFKKRPNVLAGFTLTVSMENNHSDAYYLEKEIASGLMERPPPHGTRSRCWQLRSALKPRLPWCRQRVSSALGSLPLPRVMELSGERA